jgi:hypothetical protein
MRCLAPPPLLLKHAFSRGHVDDVRRFVVQHETDTLTDQDERADCVYGQNVKELSVRKF